MTKKLLVVIALLLLPTSAVGADVSAPDVRSYYIEELNALFSVEVDGHIEWFYVFGTRKTDLATGAEQVRGGAFRGQCEKGGCLLRGEPVTVTKFEVADDYSWAELRLSDGDQTHRLRFKAGDPYVIVGPGLWEGTNPCGGEDVQQYARNWNAQAEGVVFGRHVSTATEANAKEREAEAIDTSYFVRTCP